MGICHSVIEASEKVELKKVYIFLLHEKGNGQGTFYFFAKWTRFAKEQ